MRAAIDRIREDPDRLSTWLDRLFLVFKAMDAGYAEAAERCGFVCRGCEENCCRTRFHHHTFLEYLSIYRGVMELTAREKEVVKKKAGENRRKYAAADAAGSPVTVWCPLNGDGRCVVYAYRPMICRLHGIPHELHHPGGKIVRGAGCASFEVQRQCGVEFSLDRTPFYKAMAHLEKAFRVTAGVNGGLKLTIAEMIGTF
ncbi:MAG: hypothetical protein LJE94_05965 [Deltaproteobacteria bacterium]|nr:hypothetical protein [Deltaproteobacteria bacterium]